MEDSKNLTSPPVTELVLIVTWCCNKSFHLLNINMRTFLLNEQKYCARRKDSGPAGLFISPVWNIIRMWICACLSCSTVFLSSMKCRKNMSVCLVTYSAVFYVILAVMGIYVMYISVWVGTLISSKIWASQAEIQITVWLLCNWFYNFFFRRLKINHKARLGICVCSWDRHSREHIQPGHTQKVLIFIRPLMLVGFYPVRLSP
jgi:hypothetical protein